MRYKVAFDMPTESRELVPVEAPKEKTKEKSKEKKASKKSVKEEKQLVLNRAQAIGLIGYVEDMVSAHGCDHTLRYTMQWLQEALEPDEVEKALAEIRDMGGYCDCEVTLNCYEEYDE